MKKTLLLTSVFSVLALSANAQYYQQKQPSSSSFYFQPYLGVDYNYMMSDIDTDDGDGDSFNIEDNLHAFSLSIGARIHDYFGLEAFFQKSQKGKDSGIYYGFKYNTKFEVQAFGLDGVFYSPKFANNKLEFIGTAGVGYYRMKLSASFPGIISESAKDDHIGYRFGAGFQYYLHDKLALRLMGHYNYTGIDDAENLYDITAGIRLYF